MDDKISLMLEAEKRGILPAEKAPLLAEARSRGLIPANARPDSATPAGQKPIYPQQSPMRVGADALETLKTPVPGLDQAGKFLSETAPGYIAEKTGASQIPGVPGAGLAAATALGTAGEMVPRTVGDVAAQLIAEPLAKGAGAAAKAITPLKEWAGKVGTSLLARDIGVAEPFIENVKKNPQVLKGISEDMSTVLNHAKTMSDIMKRGVDRLGGHISAIEDKFIENQIRNPEKMQRVPLGDILGQFKENILKRGVEGAGPASDINGRFIQNLSKTNAITGKDAEKITSYVGELKKYQEQGASAIDLLRLKRRLGDEIAWSKEEATAKQIGTQANGMLQGLYKDVQRKLESISPELKEASAEYAKARKQYDVLQRKVFGGSPEEAYNRVKLRIQRGVAPQALLERAMQIDSASEKAMRGLIDRVSAQQFSPFVRKGISGGSMAGFGIGAAASAAMGHGIVPMAADAAAIVGSSPRLAALGIRGSAGVSSASSAATEALLSMVKNNPNAARALAQMLANQRPK